VTDGYVVAVPVYKAAEKTALCIEAIDKFTPPGVELLLVDDGSCDSAVDALLEEVAARSHRTVRVLSRRDNWGFVRTANQIFDEARPADVLLVNSDVIVGPDWSVAMHRLAHRFASCATVTAATNHGTVASLDDFSRVVAWQDVLDGKYPSSERHFTTLLTAVGHCVYFRRTALDLVGGFDLAYGEGYGEEVDFSQRALNVGFHHLLATDVFVYHFGSQSFAHKPDMGREQAQGLSEVLRRYPTYPKQIQDVERMITAGGLESRRIMGLRSWLVKARGLLLGLDYRMVGAEGTGTTQLVTETARALARHEQVASLMLYVDRDNPVHLQHPSDFFVDDEVVLRRLSTGEVPTNHECDVFIRPSQFVRESELPLALAAAPRWHLHVLDGIAYENPQYWRDADEWMIYRALQERSVASADSVSALSASVGDWMVAAGLLDHGPMVAHCAVPSRITGEHYEPVLAALNTLRLVQYGAAFLHKNRTFTVDVAVELARRGWDVDLAFAGPDPTYGSSRDQELTRLAIADAELGRGPCSVGKGSLLWRRSSFVSEEQLHALVRQATVVLYPSTVEGFGMVPFEAAAWGTPCLASSAGGLSEVLPPTVLMSTFDVAHWADAVEELATDPASQTRNIDGIRGRGERLDWSASANLFVMACLDALEQPKASYARIAAGNSPVLPQMWDHTGVPGISAAELAQLRQSAAELHTIYTSRRWHTMSKLLSWVNK
jgi:GT2 family glycosyltransferase